ncbi:hypothetical protein ACTXT7_002768 [Hymenolepis weldensis]
MTILTLQALREWFATHELRRGRAVWSSSYEKLTSYRLVDQFDETIFVFNPESFFLVHVAPY